MAATRWSMAFMSLASLVSLVSLVISPGNNKPGPLVWADSCVCAPVSVAKPSTAADAAPRIDHRECRLNAAIMVTRRKIWSLSSSMPTKPGSAEPPAWYSSNFTIVRP